MNGPVTSQMREARCADHTWGYRSRRYGMAGVVPLSLHHYHRRTFTTRTGRPSLEAQQCWSAMVGPIDTVTTTPAHARLGRTTLRSGFGDHVRSQHRRRDCLGLPDRRLLPSSADSRRRLHGVLHIRRDRARRSLGGAVRLGCVPRTSGCARTQLVELCLRPRYPPLVPALYLPFAWTSFVTAFALWAATTATVYAWLMDKVAASCLALAGDMSFWGHSSFRASSHSSSIGQTTVWPLLGFVTALAGT